MKLTLLLTRSGSGFTEVMVREEEELVAAFQGLRLLAPSCLKYLNVKDGSTDDYCLSGISSLLFASSRHTSSIRMSSLLSASAILLRGDGMLRRPLGVRITIAFCLQIMNWLPFIEFTASITPRRQLYLLNHFR